MMPRAKLSRGYVISLGAGVGAVVVTRVIAAPLQYFNKLDTCQKEKYGRN
jgi:hypothetical protein